MKVTLKKGLGNAFLNAVRSAAYQCFPVVRPIGFKVGGTSNVVHISDVVVEDMTSFISSVCSNAYKYTGSQSGGLIHTQAECNGELWISNLLHGSVIKPSADACILHSLHPVSVEVVFGLGTGVFLVNENESAMQDAGFTGFVPVNSRHCVVDCFTFKKIGSTDYDDVFDVTIRTVDGTNSETVFNAAVDSVNKICTAVRL